MNRYNKNINELKNKSKMKHYLCKCNRCDSILFDENPGENSVLIDITTIEEPINNMIHFYGGGKFYWGCPNCCTDSYLIDIIDNDLKK